MLLKFSVICCIFGAFIFPRTEGKLKLKSADLCASISASASNAPVYMVPCSRGSNFQLVGSNICAGKTGCISPLTSTGDQDACLSYRTVLTGSRGEKWAIPTYEPYVLINANGLCLTSVPQTNRKPPMLYEKTCVQGNRNQQFIFVN